MRLLHKEYTDGRPSDLLAVHPEHAAAMLADGFRDVSNSAVMLARWEREGRPGGSDDGLND